LPVENVSHVTLTSLRAETGRTLISTGDIMNISKSLIACAIAASLVTGAYAVASSSKANANLAMYGVGAPMAWPERKALITTVVRKWSAYVQKVHGIKPQVWARSMGATFAFADPANFRRAAAMTTYEGMIATLLGQKTTDEAIINSLAKDSTAANLAALASPASGLVYTMITPCRIIDTRLTIAGKISAGTTRDFDASRPGGNFTDQGGEATDCGIPADPAAVVMNITVDHPEGAGYLTVFPYGVTKPYTSSANYVFNQTVGNEIVVKQTVGDVADFSAFAFARLDLVADAVGYFAAPAATALDTTIANSVDNTVSNGASYSATADCPTGYSVTAGGPMASPNTTMLTLSESYPTGNGWKVTGMNYSGGDVVIHARAVCSRD
jgi:hypothetical protein